MSELNPVISTCGMGLMLSLFIMTFSLNLAYTGRKWLSALREMFNAGF